MMMMMKTRHTLNASVHHCLCNLS